MELSLFHKAFIIFGKSHTEGKPRNFWHILSIAYNILHISGTIFVAISIVMASTKSRSFGLSVAFTIQLGAFFLWSIISSINMFIMARKKTLFVMESKSISLSTKTFGEDCTCNGCRFTSVS